MKEISSFFELSIEFRVFFVFSFSLVGSDAQLKRAERVVSFASPAGVGDAKKVLGVFYPRAWDSARLSLLIIPSNI